MDPHPGDVIQASLIHRQEVRESTVVNMRAWCESFRYHLSWSWYSRPVPAHPSSSCTGSCQGAKPGAWQGFDIYFLTKSRRVIVTAIEPESYLVLPQDPRGICYFKVSAAWASKVKVFRVGTRSWPRGLQGAYAKGKQARLSPSQERELFY